MFNKRNNQNAQNNQNFGYFEERFQGNPYYQNIPGQMPNSSIPNPNMAYGNTPNQQGQMYPNIQYERIQYEIKEDRRRINNLAKRITRIENYLRIRDDSEYANIEEENSQLFGR